MSLHTTYYMCPRTTIHVSSCDTCYRYPLHKALESLTNTVSASTVPVSRVASLLSSYSLHDVLAILKACVSMCDCNSVCDGNRVCSSSNTCVSQSTPRHSGPPQVLRVDLRALLAQKYKY